MSISGHFRSLAKALAFRVFARPTRIRSRLHELAQADVVTSLNLHRVAPDDNSGYRPLDPALFDALIRFTKTHFELRTYEDRDEPSERPRLILSFDDGYRDFYEVAAPILAEHGVRVNHNLVPECIETGRPPLNVMAQDFVGKAPKDVVDALDIPGFDGQPSANDGADLSHFLKMRPIEEQRRLADYLVPQFERLDGFRATAMMSRSQVQEIAAVHEIGAHSMAHASMEFESEAMLRKDAATCKAYFRDLLGREVDIYAFPNGSLATGQADIILDEGYSHVLLVGEDFDRDPKVHHRFTFDARSRHEMTYKALGRHRPVMS